jgi:hypothetical protein
MSFSLKEPNTSMLIGNVNEEDLDKIREIIKNFHPLERYPTLCDASIANPYPIALSLVYDNSFCGELGLRWYQSGQGDISYFINEPSTRIVKKFEFAKDFISCYTNPQLEFEL